MMWPIVLAGAAGCYLIKLLGYLLPQEWLSGKKFAAINALLPIALLSSLVVVLTFSAPTGLTIDARIAGVAVAVLLLALRAPFLLVVFGAAATAALLRLTGFVS
jgi:uncharacterized membrane protein